MRANHAPAELAALVDKQTEDLNNGAPEEVRIENFRAIQQYKATHREE